MAARQEFISTTRALHPQVPAKVLRSGMVNLSFLCANFWSDGPLQFLCSCLGPSYLLLYTLTAAHLFWERCGNADRSKPAWGHGI